MIRETYRVLPVPKAISIVARVSADHRDKSVHHQHHHEEDFEYGQVEFRNSKVANGKSVQDAGMVSDTIRLDRLNTHL